MGDRPSDDARLRQPLDLFAIDGTALIDNSIAGDGETTWFEGVMLIGVYALLALAFFFTSPAVG